MAIYEYECECGNEIAIQRKISEGRPDTIPCSRCGEDAKKVLSRSSFALKGSGWYKDGYAERTPEPAKKPKPKKGLKVTPLKD